MAMGAVAAGAAGAAAAGNCCFQVHVSAVPDGPAFGNGAAGVVAAASITFDGCIRLGKGTHCFKFMIAVFANIFVNRHFFSFRSRMGKPFSGFSRLFFLSLD